MRILRGCMVLAIAGLAACGGGDGAGMNNGPRTNVDPVAAFTATCDGLTCAMTDQSTDADGTIQSHAWEFGDGATSSEPNPTHTYADPGSFTVRLTVTDDDGDTGTATRTVTMIPDPVAPFSGTYERE